MSDKRLEALRVIAYGSARDMQEFLTEIDPDGYYPNATERNGLWIHIARVMCAQLSHGGATRQEEKPNDWRHAAMYEGLTADDLGYDGEHWD